MRQLTIIIILLIAGGAIAQKELTLEDAVMQQWGKFYPQRTNGVEWIPNTGDYTFLSADYQTLKRGNAKKSDAEKICSTADLKEWTGEGFNYVNVLQWKDEKSFYTKTGKKYFLVDIEEEKANLVAELPDNAENVHLCSVNDYLAYTRGDQLFVRFEENNEVMVGESVEGIVTGQAIARREFGIQDGIFWSNSGKFVGFYQKDETPVADYPLLDITTPTGSLRSVKYPMAGQKSEKAMAGVYNVETGKTMYIKPQGGEYDYLTNFSWGPNDKYFYVIELNRGQDHAKLQKYEASSGALIATLLEEKHEKWVEPEHPIYFVNDHEFIYMSEKDGFMNLYLYKDDGTFVKQLTDNDWVINDISGHDEDGNVYFTGTGENPLQTHYFKVNIKSGKQTQLTDNGGSHSVKFSSDYAYLFDQMSSSDVPNLEVIRDNKGKVKREILKADNPLKDYKIGTAEISTIKAADGKTDLYQRLIKPSDFDESKKHPVLVYVYGGPHAQLINDRWLDGASLWMYWMAEQGYLVYTVDNRGSANRGFEFESVIHRQLGDAEIADQLEGVDYLKSLPYVDGDRLAVHGWSFGGFMTTSLMLRRPGVFTTGVAGGPVTDWSYYEVMYGERYMDTPEENPQGYKNNRLSEYVDNLEGKLLLIHGTADDVVVMQHNLALVKAFVEAGKQMDFFPYPMHKHNVRGKDRVHLMRKVLDYVLVHNR